MSKDRLRQNILERMYIIMLITIVGPIEQQQNRTIIFFYTQLEAPTFVDFKLSSPFRVSMYFICSEENVIV